MTATEYQLLHNLSAHFWRPYEPGDWLASGYTGTLDEAAPADLKGLVALAEQVFAHHNEPGRPDGASAPSLSVGDIVLFGEIALSVASEGFTAVTIDPDDLTTLTWDDGYYLVGLRRNPA